MFVVVLVRPRKSQNPRNRMTENHRSKYSFWTYFIEFLHLEQIARLPSVDIGKVTSGLMRLILW